MDSIIDYDGISGKKGKITEVYEVVRTVEVVREGKDRFRLELIKGYRNNKEDYDVMGWRYVLVEGKRSMEYMNVPWQHVDNPDLALKRAIGWLVSGDI